MESSKLGFQVWVLATYLMTTGIKGTSSMKLHRDLNVTQKHTWHLAHRIREAWEKNTPSFTGPAEVDETYIGGARRTATSPSNAAGAGIVASPSSSA